MPRTKISDLIGRTIILLVFGCLTACATLPTDFERRPSAAFTNTQDTFLGREIAPEAAAHPGLSGFFMLGNGLDAFTARALTARRAERTIDAQYYLYHSDLIGKLFTWKLIQAAERGVRSSIPTSPRSASGPVSGTAS